MATETQTMPTMEQLIERLQSATPQLKKKAYASLFSPGSATYSPPFFKCFLRLDVTPDSVRLRCFAATGNLAQELDPPVEDEITIPLA